MNILFLGCEATFRKLQNTSVNVDTTSSKFKGGVAVPQPRFVFKFVDCLKSFYELVFASKKAPFDVLIIEDSVDTASMPALYACLENYFHNFPVYLLSFAIDAKSPPWVKRFGVDDLSLRKLLYDVASSSLRADFNSLQTEPSWMMPSEMEQDIEWLLKKYETLINGIGEAIIGLNGGGEITFVNPSACNLFGKQEAELLGYPFSEFALDVPAIEPIGGSENQSASTKRHVGRGVISRADNSLVYVEYTQTFVSRSADGTVSVMVIEDISDRIKFEAKLRSLANKDMLTQLHNRYYFERAVQNELTNRRGKQQDFAVALIDLDGFKQVNDKHGHATGDKLLIMLAKRLKDSLRRGDLIARLGGDEFVVLIKNGSLENVRYVANHLLQVISEPIPINNKNFVVSASIGVCMSDDADTLSEYLEKADRAMYEIKRQGKNGVAVFNSDSFSPEGLRSIKRSIN